MLKRLINRKSGASFEVLPLLSNWLTASCVGHAGWKERETRTGRANSAGAETAVASASGNEDANDVLSKSVLSQV